jgi:hypothetical protein
MSMSAARTWSNLAIARPISTGYFPLNFWRLGVCLEFNKINEGSIKLTNPNNLGTIRLVPVL